MRSVVKDEIRFDFDIRKHPLNNTPQLIIKAYDYQTKINYKCKIDEKTLTDKIFKQQGDEKIDSHEGFICDTGQQYEVDAFKSILIDAFEDKRSSFPTITIIKSENKDKLSIRVGFSFIHLFKNIILTLNAKGELDDHRIMQNTLDYLAEKTIKKKDKLTDQQVTLLIVRICVICILFVSLFIGKN